MQQSTFPSPYMNTIDVETTEEITFKCCISPRDIVTDYLFTIKNFNTNATVYTVSGTLQTPLYGGANGETWLEIAVPQGKLTNGNDYIWNVILANRKYVCATFPISSNTSSIVYISDDSAKLVVDETVKKNMLIASYNSSTTKYIGFVSDVSEYSSGYNTQIKVLNKTDYLDMPEELTTKSTAIVYEGMQSYDYYFKARSNGEILLTVPTEINSPKIELGGEYAQAQNIRMAYYQFNLYCGAELINSTDNVVSSNLYYSYNGLETGKDYMLELIVVDDEKRQTTVYYDFVVQYKKHKSIIPPSVNIDYSDMSVRLDFSKLVSAEGELSDGAIANYQTFIDSAFETSDTSNGLCLNKDEFVFWNSVNDVSSLNFNDTIQIIHWHGHEGFYGDIMRLSDDTNSTRDIVVGYDGEAFYYTIGVSSTVYFDPYTNGRATAIGTEGTSIDDLTLYILDDTDELKDDDYLLSNDIAYKYWWIIVVYPDRVEFVRSVKFEDTVVSE